MSDKRSNIQKGGRGRGARRGDWSDKQKGDLHWKKDMYLAVSGIRRSVHFMATLLEKSALDKRDKPSGTPENSVSKEKIRIDEVMEQTPVCDKEIDHEIECKEAEVAEEVNIQPETYEGQSVPMVHSDSEHTPQRKETEKALSVDNSISKPKGKETEKRMSLDNNVSKPENKKPKKETPVEVNQENVPPATPEEMETMKDVLKIIREMGTVKESTKESSKHSARSDRKDTPYKYKGKGSGRYRRR